MSDEQRFASQTLSLDQQQRLHDFLHTLQVEADHYLGYPCSREFDYSALFPFLSYPINNVGDPFVESNYHLNSQQFEREVIQFFIELTHASQHETWGYVTNGGTEGNMYGIYLARETFPNGLVYYSEATHYSVPKILRMVHARNIMIRSQENGEIDYQDLAETIRIHRDVPPIIFANIGTTMTGAVDNLDKIKLIMHDLTIKQYYIHCDAALGGMILPFVDNPQPFDFSAGIDSIAISGHKMIGSPIPCGLALAKKAHVDRISRAVEYVGSYDTTVTGSRNGITPLFLWYAINTKGRKGFRRMIQHCLKMADYTLAAFHQIGIKAWCNPNSITVVFPRQAEQVMKQWQIAMHDNLAHIITMPHVRTRQVDALIADIVASKSSNKCDIQSGQA